MNYDDHDSNEEITHALIAGRADEAAFRRGLIVGAAIIKWAAAIQAGEEGRTPWTCGDCHNGVELSWQPSCPACYPSARGRRREELAKPKPKSKPRRKAVTKKSARHGREAPGHPDGCRCYPLCDPSR